MVASRPPKSRLYGTTDSYSTRCYVTTLVKNDGQKWITDINKKCQLSPGSRTEKHYNKEDAKACCRYSKCSTSAFKKRRLFLKQKKSDLLASIDENTDSIILYFDLETSGFNIDADIFQIAVKYESYSFSSYINLTRKIPEKVSEVHGLTFMNGQLHYHCKPVVAVNLQEALIVSGFADTYPVIKAATRLAKKGDNKLENFAQRLNINSCDAHNAMSDVAMLEKIDQNLNITKDDIIKSYLSWSAAKTQVTLTKKNNSQMKFYRILNNCTSKSTREKMIAADISVKVIESTYKQYGLQGLFRLLGRDHNGKVLIDINCNVAFSTRHAQPPQRHNTKDATPVQIIIINKPGEFIK
ncbi:hypothetical protein PV326_005581 [Microctonus aethiopoides]|nr:hypothetical protein PV326_005581 [Microctonus aethiopoides]